MNTSIIHDTYLPFSKSDLAPHFRDEKHLDQLIDSCLRHTTFMHRYKDLPIAMSVSSEVKRERQIEKDERAWTVKSLKTAFEKRSLPKVLEEAFSFNTEHASEIDWESLVGDPGDLELYFEVGLSSPQAYRAALRSRYENAAKELDLLPYLQEAATGRSQLEGATRVDAVIVNRVTKFAILFEAKYLSDTSPYVTFDPIRNQLARNIDVLLSDDSDLLPVPLDRRYFCLLTPEVFRQKPRSRHYGMLLHEYRNHPETLCEDLPHQLRDKVSAASKRIGWATYEGCLR